MLQGFEPVVDERTKLLVLGSFPGKVSLDKQQYYGHPQNAFWHVMSVVIDEDLIQLPYDERLTTLLENRVGLWDIIERCTRESSADADITDAVHVDLEEIFGLADIDVVAFNGKKASSREPDVKSFGVQTLVLPSTSPAYAVLSPSDKARIWTESIRAAGFSPSA